MSWIEISYALNFFGIHCISFHIQFFFLPFLKLENLHLSWRRAFLKRSQTQATTAKLQNLTKSQSQMASAMMVNTSSKIAMRGKSSATPFLPGANGRFSALYSLFRY